MEEKSYNELRKECKAKGLSCKGKKTQLIARLRDYVGQEKKESNNKSCSSSSLKNAASVFANLLVAGKAKAKKSKKKMMATHLDSGLNLDSHSV